MTAMAAATQKGALSSSWYQPDEGKYVDRDMADWFKEMGTSQRHLGDIVKDYAPFCVAAAIAVMFGMSCFNLSPIDV